MSILDQARALAEKRQNEVDKKAADDAAEAEHYRAALRPLESALLDEIKKLDGQKNKYGTFQVDLKGNRVFSVIAYLRSNNDLVAWFKAAVVRGTAEYSDDCRGLPYTEPRVWAHFYYPNMRHRDGHDGTWDVQELRRNGGWTESCSTQEGLPKFFEAVAKHLATWL